MAAITQNLLVYLFYHLNTSCLKYSLPILDEYGNWPKRLHKKKRLHSNQPMLGKYMQITTQFILAKYSVFFFSCYRYLRFNLNSRIQNVLYRQQQIILFSLYYYTPIGYVCVYIYSGTFEICPQGVVPARPFLISFSPQFVCKK